jgi:D-amino-acid dehydrogenase
MAKDSVIVVGAGHIGIACAHYLHNDDYDVTVIDRSTVGGGCSHANCGFLVPSHVLPLTAPEAVWTGMKSLFQPEAAFRVKPQLRVELYRFMFEFGRRCTTRQMLRTGKVLQKILSASMVEFEKLLSDPAMNCDWQDNGMLFVFRNHDDLQEFGLTDAMLADEFGLTARLIDGADLAKFEPALLDDLAGAYFYKSDSHLRPDRLNTVWSEQLARNGVSFVEQCSVEAVETLESKVTGLLTTQGKMTADHYVFAAGAWSSHFADSLGCRIPVEPGKGYSVTMTQPEIMPTHPMLIPEKHIGITPFADGYRIASMMEFAGFDDSIPRARIQQLKDSAVPYLKTPEGPVELDAWYGWRPMTWDSLPIIGRVPRLSNALLATGHNMLGLSLAPMTGKAIADLLAERPTDLPLDALSPTRFL